MACLSGEDGGGGGEVRLGSGILRGAGVCRHADALEGHGEGGEVIWVGVGEGAVAGLGRIRAEGVGQEFEVGGCGRGESVSKAVKDWEKKVD